MKNAQALLDRMPAVVRHGLIVFGGTLSGALLNAVVNAQGVTGVQWGTVIPHSIDSAFYATAVTLVALVVTPLTRQYGVGAKATVTE